ncbi:MAG: hypothetical protein E7496_02660 [Ruminococcus sp.]|nr:hypothetical protein [Ruminococcus sp.]
MENLLGKMQELLSDPESMKQISELAQMFKSGETASSPETSSQSSEENLPDFDPGLLLKAGELFRQPEDDKNTALLLALRPHLGESRQIKLDKAVRLLKLWHIWKQLQASGMLQNLL